MTTELKVDKLGRTYAIKMTPRGPEYSEIPIAERFWAKTKPVSNGCIEWTGAKGPSGYGNFFAGGAFLRAHRMAWQLGNGRKIPAGMVVMHTCDNPSCVKPEHLKIGTHKDNSRDMVDKRRHRPDARARGERNANAKLTELDVIEMRGLYASGWTVRKIRELFHVSDNCVRRIITRKNWRHVGGAYAVE